jgi:hypothetical protein
LSTLTSKTALQTADALLEKLLKRVVGRLSAANLPRMATSGIRIWLRTLFFLVSVIAGAILPTARAEFPPIVLAIPTAGCEDLTVDDEGNIYVSYYGTLKSFDTSGNLRWQKIIDSTPDGSTQNRLASEGTTVYLAVQSYYSDTRREIRLFKLTKDGIVEWERKLGENNMVWVSNIEIGPQGNVFVGGRLGAKPDLLAVIAPNGDLVKRQSFPELSGNTRGIAAFVADMKGG